MITAGMEAGAARLGHGEKIPSCLLFCVSIKRETLLLKTFFFFFKSLGIFIQPKKHKLAFPKQAESKVIFLLYPSDMSWWRFIHWSSEGGKMRDWEGQGLEGIADLSFLMATRLKRDLLSLHVLFLELAFGTTPPPIKMEREIVPICQILQAEQWPSEALWRVKSSSSHWDSWCQTTFGAQTQISILLLSSFSSINNYWKCVGISGRYKGEWKKGRKHHKDSLYVTLNTQGSIKKEGSLPWCWPLRVRCTSVMAL